MSVVLTTATMHDVSGLPRDDMQNSFVFEAASLAAVIAIAEPAVKDFYQGVGGTSGRYQEVIAANEHACNDSKGVMPVVALFPFLMRLKGGKDRALNLGRRDTPDRANVGLPSPQQR